MDTRQQEGALQAQSLLPPMSANGSLTNEQWAVFAAIAEAVVPSVVPEQAGQFFRSVLQTVEGEGKQERVSSVSAYLAESALSSPEFKDSIMRTVTFNMSPAERKQIAFVLNTLDGRASILMTGHRVSLKKLTITEREKVIQSWGTARMPLFRALHLFFTKLVIMTWVNTSPGLRQVLSFPKTPVNHSFGTGFPFPFIQVPPADEGNIQSSGASECFETDILVLGSGCTGSVAASVLSQSGLQVLLAEKAYYWPPRHLPMSAKQAGVHLFHNGGLQASDSGNVSMAAGSCFGGGGTVNWSASLQPQSFVRAEFARDHDLPYFTSNAFQADLDAVCERMGVGTSAIKHNWSNLKLLEGARKLGLRGVDVPQNTGGETHYCGHCTYGCGSCGKKGPTETWLPDAARSGAKFIEGFHCSAILFSDDATQAGDKIAVGAYGIWTSRDESGGIAGKRYTRSIKIMARKAVVVAAGALSTPHLLLRSGLSNAHIGKHLKLQPVCSLGAVWDKDTNPWEGGIITSLVPDLENLDGRGHGVKLEPTVMVPGLFLPFYPWESGFQYKAFAAKLKRMSGYISVARDIGEGVVYVDPHDPSRLRVKYNVGKKDQQHLAVGLVTLAKILFVEGAREIFSSTPGMPTFVRGSTLVRRNPAESGAEDLEHGNRGVNDPAFSSWLKHLERMTTDGMPSLATFASAHQMGSARMGASPRTSAVDPTGRVWGTQGLYLADTSVFPAASGVNPMITGMGIARGIARGLAKKFAKG